MLLASTSDLVRITTSSTADLDVHAKWSDTTSTDFTLGRTNTAIAAAATTTVVGSPAASTSRQVLSLLVRNDHATDPNTITIFHTDGVTTSNVWKGTLAAGEAVDFDGKGFVRLDSTGKPVTSTGGVPGGSANQVQYNSGGTGFGGAANVSIEGGNLNLGATTDPSAPSSGLTLYSKSVAGRLLPKIVGPVGIDTILQAGLHGNAVMMISPANTTTAPNCWGGTLTTAATMSSPITIASANPWLATWRKRFQTSTAAGNITGMRTAYLQYFLGTAGFGGFWFRAQFGHNINLNGGQKFIGLCASTAALAATANSVSALLNMCGVGYDSSDSSAGNWFFLRNDGAGAATKVDLGSGMARANTTHGYDLIMFAPPDGSTEIFVRIVNIHDGTVILDTSYTTDLPTANTGMAFKCEVNNGAVAAADNIECAKVYIETDY